MKQTKADQQNELTPCCHFVNTLGIVFKIKLIIDFTPILCCDMLHDKRDGKE